MYLKKTISVVTEHFGHHANVILNADATNNALVKASAPASITAKDTARVLMIANATAINAAAKIIAAAKIMCQTHATTITTRIKMNTKPSYRLEDFVGEEGEAEIISSALIKSLKSVNEDRTFSRCKCNPDCDCNKECRCYDYCKCDDDCKCDDKSPLPNSFGDGSTSAVGDYPEH